MKIPDWIAIVLMLGFILVGLAIFSTALYSAISSYMKFRFTKCLQEGLLHNDLTFDDFLNLKQVMGLDNKMAYSALASLKVKIDYSQLSQREKIKPRLDTLIKDFQVKQPYSDLPDDIKESLISTRDKVTPPELIDDIADKLRIHIKRKKKGELISSFIMYTGYLFGLVGFLITIFK